MIAPFQRLFAEGFIYRQAADHPRSMITVLGVWLIFGVLALSGLTIVLLAFQRAGGSLVATVADGVFGAAIIAVSLAMIWKTTRNYLARNEIDHKTEA